MRAQRDCPGAENSVNLGKIQQRKSSVIPVPITVCSIFVCPEMVYKYSCQCFGIVYVRADVDACDCTRGGGGGGGLYGHRT